LFTKRILTPAIFAALVLLAVGSAGSTPGFVASGALPTLDLNDQGMFVMYVASRNVGTEKFEIRSSAGRIEACAAINLRIEQGGKITDIRTFPELVLSSQLEPLTYKWSQTGPEFSQLSVDFHSSPVRARYKTVSGDEDTRDFDLPKGVIVLDDNVLHHYQLVVDRYRLTSGGRQTFHAFIPQEALPGTLTVEDLGRETVDLNGTAATLDHLVVATEMAKINLWIDGQQRLQRITVPEAQLEADRKQ
jgi:hypothetical protein